MQQYLDSDIFETHHGFVLVERTVGESIQTGLIVALDLEKYDYNRGSKSLVRATEGTILDRLPPRMQVRRGAPLELPHILVLYDDPHRTVLTPILEQKENLPLAYDFDLMEGSGHICGHYIEDPAMLNQAIENIAALISPEAYGEKYGEIEDAATAPLLLQSVTAITLWRPPKRSGKSSNPLLGLTTLPVTPWSSWSTSTIPL